jgi:hypothetical protein
MRNAKVTAAITAAVAAVLAVLGKAFNFGVDTTTQILMRFGYDWGRAAARAPFYFSLSIALIGLLACTGASFGRCGASRKATARSPGTTPETLSIRSRNGGVDRGESRKP